MSFYIDKKYILQISSRLQLFKKKTEESFSCRCPLCGDSKKSKTKTRGNFYRLKDSLLYKCFNCGVCLNADQFLEHIDPKIRKEYIFEKYSYNNTFKWNDKQQAKNEQVVVKKQSKILHTPAKDNLASIDSLPDTHGAKQYVIKRKIPKEHWKNLYYTTDYRLFINKHCDKTKFTKVVTRDTDPRLVIPFLDKHGNEFAWQGRTLLQGKEPRYITINPKENDEKTIFGLDRVNLKEKVYILEGPIDSLFIPNGIAVAGSSLFRFKHENSVYIFDNEPRNKELCAIIEKLIDSQKNVVIFPKEITCKDINDMILCDMTKNQIMELISDNTFSGITAKLKFNNWKKC